MGRMWGSVWERMWGSVWDYLDWGAMMECAWEDFDSRGMLMRASNSFGALIKNVYNQKWIEHNIDN